MANTNSSQANASRFKPCLMLALCSLLLVAPCGGTAEIQKAFLDAHTIYEAWESNYGNIKSMKFRLSQAQALSDGDGFQTYSRWHHWEKIEDGKRIYARTTNSEKGFADVDSVVITSFDGKVGKKYTPKLKQGSVYLGLKGAIPEIRNPMKACLCAGTVHISGISSNLEEDDPQRKLMEKLMDKFPEGIPTFTFHFWMSQQTGQVRVLTNLESVAGQMCHVLEIGDPKDRILTKYWIAHDKGMLPMRYLTRYGPDDYAKMEVVEIASVESNLGKYWYPVLIKRERKRDGGGHRHEVRVHEFIPHIKVPPETFDIDFPVGTRIADRIANVSYIVGGGTSISRPKLDGKPINRPIDAAEGTDDQEDPRLQPKENVNNVNPNDVNDVSVNLNVLGDSENSSNLKPTLIIVAAILVALVLIIFIRSKTSTSKETK